MVANPKPSHELEITAALKSNHIPFRLPVIVLTATSPIVPEEERCVDGYSEGGWMGAAKGNHGLQDEDDEKSKKNTPGIIKVNPRTYLLIYIYMLTVHSAEAASAAAEVAPWKLKDYKRVRVAKLADASCLCGPTENPNVIRNIKTEYQFQSNEYILATGLVSALPHSVHGLPVEKGYWLGFTMETGDTVCPPSPVHQRQRG